MLDSIHISIPKQLIKKPQYDHLTKLVAFNKVSKNHFTGNKCEAGNYKNFNVAINNRTVCINGSLPKFCYNNNVQSIPSNEINDALQQLAFELNLPIFKGELRRIDIAESFPVDSELAYYFASLLDTPAYDRARDQYGVRFRKNNMVLAFYDKSYDSVHSTSSYGQYGEKVLRIELRIVKRLRQTLFPSSRKLKAVMLLSDTLKNKAAEIWIKQFAAIIKRRELFEPSSFEGWKDLRNYLASERIHQLKLPVVFDMIELSAKQNKWSSVKKCNVKSEVRDAYNNSILSEPNKYAVELERKVEQSAISKHLRMSSTSD